MKERVLGEIFEHPTKGKLQVNPEHIINECFGCAFAGKEVCSNDPEMYHTGKCASKNRTDKRGVIFEKVEVGNDKD